MNNQKTKNLNYLKKELLQVERSINQLLDQIEQGFGGAAVGARLKDRETEQAALLRWRQKALLLLLTNSWWPITWIR